MNSIRQAYCIYLTKVSVLYSAVRYVRSAVANVRSAVRNIRSTLRDITQELYPYKFITGFIDK